MRSLLGGRFALTADPKDDSYFVDRDGTHFRHVLNLLRDPVNFLASSDLTAAQKMEFESELNFYGLFDVLQRNQQEHVGRLCVKRAYLAGQGGFYTILHACSLDLRL